MSSSDTPCSWKRTATRICSYLTYIFLLMDTAINNMRSSLKKKMKNNFRETLAGYNRNPQICSHKGLHTHTSLYVQRYKELIEIELYTQAHTRAYIQNDMHTHSTPHKRKVTNAYVYIRIYIPFCFEYLC